MKRSQSIGRLVRHARKHVDLVAKYRQRQFGIKRRVVDVTALEATALIVLDQMMVRVPRESQRIEPKRIDYRTFQNSQPDGSQ